jgi:hypothetical protein
MVEEGKVIGKVYENPVLNTTLYDVEFPNGMVRSYAALLMLLQKTFTIW